MKKFIAVVVTNLLVFPAMGDQLPQSEYENKRFVCTDGAYEDEKLDEGVESLTYIEFRKMEPDFIERGYIEHSNASAHLACPALIFNGLDGYGKAMGFKCAGVWNMDLVDNPHYKVSTGSPKKLAVDTVIVVEVLPSEGKNKWVASFTAAKMDGSKKVTNVPCRFIEQ